MFFFSEEQAPRTVERREVFPGLPAVLGSMRSRWKSAMSCSTRCSQGETAEEIAARMGCWAVDAPAVEPALEAELSEHLGYEAVAPPVVGGRPPPPPPARPLPAVAARLAASSASPGGSGSTIA